MSLPARWVDALFAKLTVAYGQDFLRRWEGIPLEDVKADWALELAGFSQQPDAIRHGLDNLPADKAPNAKQFRDLCRRHITAALPALPAPRVDPERLAGELQRLASIGAAPVGEDRFDWARRLRDREQRQTKGEAVTVRHGLTRFQRDAWREALGLERGAAA